MPARDLRRDGVEHALADRHDQIGLFGHRDELRRRHPAQFRMQPAHQRLGADQLAAVQVELGLVPGVQLAGRHRTAQRRQQQQPLQRGLVLQRIVAAQRVAALALGAAQGALGMAQQRVGAVAVLRKMPEADRDGDGHLMALQLDRLGQRGQPVARLGLHPLQPGIGPHHHEFIAAEPADEALPASQHPQPLGHLDQHPVAGGMAQRIVDRLEAIEPDDQQRHPAGPIAAAPGLDRLMQSRGDHLAVGQIGQRVMQPQVMRALLGLVQPRQIGADADIVGDAPDLVAQHGDRLQQRIQPAITRPVPELPLEAVMHRQLAPHPGREGRPLPPGAQQARVATDHLLGRVAGTSVRPRSSASVQPTMRSKAALQQR